MVTLQNIRIKTLILKGCANSKIHLENCWIKEVSSNHNDLAIQLTANKSYIGKLNINQRSFLGDVHFKGGGIIGIDISNPEYNNPFTGSVIFENTFFPRNKKYFIKNPQPYRNMRHHLMSLENGTTASMFHSLELAIERQEDTSTINKSFSWCYEKFSDYGASIARPLTLLISLFVLSWLSIGYFEGAKLALPEESYHYGWKESLTAPHAHYYRAAVLAGHYTLSPFGILGAKTLVIPSNGFFLFWVMLQSLLSTTFITLTILAIRRRFKLKQ